VSDFKKKIAILQSNYIPWRGYFNLISSVDEFIIYDDMQYTKNDWRNRNRVRTTHGTQWLTIPVRRVKLQQRICDTQVMDRSWAARHWRTLRQAYARAPCFQFGYEVLAGLYAEASSLNYLSDINSLFLRTICDSLGIDTRITSSSDYTYDLSASRTTRLIQLIQAANANGYLSGPAARQYLDQAQMDVAAIEVQWMDYSGYLPYTQIHGEPFEPAVSIVDLLFNVGSEAARYIHTSSSLASGT
jgi:hypothetical protein